LKNSSLSSYHEYTSYAPFLYGDVTDSTGVVWA